MINRKINVSIDYIGGKMFVGYHQNLTALPRKNKKRYNNF